MIGLEVTTLDSLGVSATYSIWDTYMHCHALIQLHIFKVDCNTRNLLDKRYLLRMRLFCRTCVQFTLPVSAGAMWNTKFMPEIQQLFQGI